MLRLLPFITMRMFLPTTRNPCKKLLQINQSVLPLKLVADHSSSTNLLRWGNEVLKKRMSSSEKAEISPKTMKRIRRAKRVTKMTQKVDNGVLSGVVKVSGYVMTSVENSKDGKKFLNMLPGEILLASFDGFSKICDATEVAGKNVLSTSSNVTTDLVTHRYEEEAGQATDEELDAAGHAFGTAWAAFKIRKALNPKNAVKASSLAKSAAKAAAAEYKSKKASK